MESNAFSPEIEAIILTAARKEFEAKGYDGARMQAIADEAGISKSSLHYHFRSKDGLFQRVFDKALEEYLPIISTLADDRYEWEDKIRHFTSALFEFIQHGRMLFIIREINRDPELLSVRLTKKKKQNSILSWFESLREAGKIGDVDPRMLYIFLNSLCCFPVINREMFQKSLRMTAKEYDQFMLTYTQSVAEFFIQAIKK